MNQAPPKAGTRLARRKRRIAGSSSTTRMRSRPACGVTAAPRPTTSGRSAREVWLRNPRLTGRFVAVIEPPVASMKPWEIGRWSIYCLARPAGAADSCRQRSGSRRHARLVEAGAAALHRAHFCRRRIPAPKIAKTSAATSCARATSQGGATRPARAIAASVAPRMPSNGSRLK
jgi:hypothetical protein